MSVCCYSFAKMSGGRGSPQSLSSCRVVRGSYSGKCWTNSGGNGGCFEWKSLHFLHHDGPSLRLAVQIADLELIC